jgi:hypothetical protein
MPEMRASWAGFSREELLKILHRPEVVAHCVKKAREVIENTGHSDAFNLVLQDRPDTIRPRAYIMPNSKGIRLEIKDGVLLKAALGMSGK